MIIRFLTCILMVFPQIAEGYEGHDRTVEPGPFIGLSYGFDYRVPRNYSPKGLGEPSFFLHSGYEFLGGNPLKLSAESQIGILKLKTNRINVSNSALAVRTGIRIVHVPMKGETISHFLPPISGRIGVLFHSNSYTASALSPYLGVGLELSGRKIGFDIFFDYIVSFMGGEYENLSGFEIGIRYVL